jgi:hypothetical protein
MKVVQTESPAKDTFTNTVKAFFGDIFVRFILFIGRLRYPATSQPVLKSATQAEAEQQPAVPLGELIREIVRLESELRNKDASNPLITYSELAHGSREWIEARMHRIQGYCTKVPFDGSNQTHLNEAARGYLLALQNQLNVLQEDK